VVDEGVVVGFLFFLNICLYRSRIVINGFQRWIMRDLGNWQRTRSEGVLGMEIGYGFRGVIEFGGGDPLTFFVGAFVASPSD
jgi:hypothetical protein